MLVLILMFLTVVGGLLQRAQRVNRFLDAKEQTRAGIRLAMELIRADLHSAITVESPGGNVLSVLRVSPQANPARLSSAQPWGTAHQIRVVYRLEEDQLFRSAYALDTGDLLSRQLVAERVAGASLTFVGGAARMNLSFVQESRIFPFELILPIKRGP